MKKFLAMMLALVMTVGLAVPAFAANEITANEQRVYDAFAAVLDKWDKFGTKGNKVVAQYKAEAKKVLREMDLDAAACDDLIACVKRADSLIGEKNPKTGKELLSIAPSVVSMVNKTTGKYGMTVSIEDVMKQSDDGFAAVNIRQTGYDMTSAIVASVVLASAVGTCLVVAGKKGYLLRGQN